MLQESALLARKLLAIRWTDKMVYINVDDQQILDMFDNGESLRFSIGSRVFELREITIEE